MSVEAPTVAQFDLQFLSTQGQYGQNSLYFSKDGGWSLADRTTMAESLVTNWGTNVAPLVPQSVSLQQISHRDLGTDPYGPISVYTPANPVPGTFVGTQAAPFIAVVLIQLLSPAGGPPFRSYIRHFGAAEDSVIGNRLDGSAEGDYELAYDALFAEDGGLAAVVPVILSRYQVIGGVLTPRATAQIAEVTEVEVRSVLGRCVSREGVGL